MKDSKSSDQGQGVSYKMYRQRRLEGFEPTVPSANAIRTLEIINSIEGLKEKYKRLKALKTKNDEVS